MSHENLAARDDFASLGWIIAYAAMASSAGIAHGAVAFAPAGLHPGDKFNLVFVTTATTTATSSSISTYDTIVSNEASAAGLSSYVAQSVTWKALASSADGTTAIGRFNPSNPIYRLDGATVANNGADLWDNTIQNPISITSDGSNSTAVSVWTGTTPTGDSSSGIGGPKSLGATQTDPSQNNATLHESEIGTIHSTNSWVFTANEPDQSNKFPLYAFSNQLTYVPEPASAASLAVAGLALMGRRGVRR